MSGGAPIGHKAALAQWRGSIRISDAFSKLVIVDRNDARCDTCGRPIARGDEAYRGYGRALMHVGCAHITGGPRGA